MFFFALAIGATGTGLWAYHEQRRAEATLAAATANGLVFDLAQRFRNAVGDVRQTQGDLRGALVSYGASLAAIESLAKSNPANAGWQRDLSVTLNRLGDVQLAQGDLRLTSLAPDNARWKQSLAWFTNQIAELSPPKP